MNKKLYYGLMTVFSIIVVGCAVYLAQYYLSTIMADNGQQELADYIETDSTQESTSDSTEEALSIQPKYEKLLGMNSDFAGWITIPDTKIDYAVMLSPDDNEYYLRRDFDKKHSMSGMLFIENRCDILQPSTNIIIYGHNMKAGTMFHDILKYDDEQFYKDHKYITFNTIWRDGSYEVIGAYYTEIAPDDPSVYAYYNFIEPADQLEFDRYISYVKAHTPYETADAVYGDQLITLSTCAYHTDEGRYVVVAKKTK